MESTLDLVERFQNMDVSIIGTREDPLFRAKDIMLNVLGYRDQSAQKWWNDIKKDDLLCVQRGQQTAGGLQ